MPKLSAFPAAICSLLSLSAAHHATAQSGSSTMTATDGTVMTVPSQGPFDGPFRPAINSSSSVNTSPALVPVFFPPYPPPLDRIARAATVTFAGGRAVSDEAAAYVNEPFYPALAARFDHGSLSDRERTALDRYREEKRALQHDLRTELAHWAALPPAERAPLMAAFARQQEPALARLEAQAEAFRADLLKSSDSWNAHREWRLGQSAKQNEAPAEISRVMLAAAYFQDGLSAAQRTLLREISLEVSAVGESAADAVTAQPYVFFSPGLARVQFPASIPDTTAAKIATYQTRRSALRKALYDAIYREDNALLAAKRTFRLQSLAADQAPEFAALEQLAEEIRRDLAPFPLTRQPEPIVEFPPVLTQRLIALFEQQNQEQLRVKGEVAKLQASLPALRISASFDRAGFRYRVSDSTTANVSESHAVAHARLAELSSAYSRAFLALSEERQAIRADLARHLGSTDVSEINVALAEGARLAIERRAAPAIADYHAAVFEPGLSPAQRRLLLDGAVEQLDLPLPRGETQPTKRRASSLGTLGRAGP